MCSLTENQNIREAAEEELIKIGNPAVPALINTLRHHSLDIATEKSIFRVLQTMSPQAVIPGLLDAFGSLGKNKVHYDLSHEIALFGQPGIPVLIEALSNANSWERWWARQALIEHSQRGQPAVPLLLEALENGSAAEARKEAALSLGQLGVRTAVPILIAALDQEDARAEAVWALGAIGDSRAAPALISLFKKSPDLVVVEALGRIKDPRVMPVLLEAWKSKDEKVRVAASREIALIPFIADTTDIPHLIALLEYADDRIVHAVAEKLGTMNDKTAILPLEKADRSFHERYQTPRGPARCAICKALHKLNSR